MHYALATLLTNIFYQIFMTRIVYDYFSIICVRMSATEEEKIFLILHRGSIVTLSFRTLTITKQVKIGWNSQV